MLSPLLFNIFFAAALLVALQRFSEDPDSILPDLVHLQEQPAKVSPETSMECVRRAVWRMLYAEDAYIVSRSPQGLERMMATLVDVFGAFGLTVSEKITEPMSLPISHIPATPIPFTTTGQQYRQTTSFVYLGGAITESSRLSAEIDRRIRAGWMSFNRYRAELYDRPRLRST